MASLIIVGLAQRSREIVVNVSHIAQRSREMITYADISRAVGLLDLIPSLYIMFASIAVLE